MTYGNHRIGYSDLPVGEDVVCSVKELSCDLVQHLTLEGDTLGQYNIERRDTVRDNHHEIVAIDAVYIAHLTYIVALLALEIEIGLYNCFHCYIFYCSF